VFTDIQVHCLSQLGLLAQEQKISLFLVGGAVRDILSGYHLQDRDLDILTEGDACQFAAIARDRFGGDVKLFSRFCTAKLISPAAFPSIGEIDFASSRTEIYESPGALPSINLAPLADDLKRRDFSVNAIALPIDLFVDIPKQQVIDSDRVRLSAIDPYHGVADLDQRQIRILHENSFRDDPTRLYRAVRYMVRIAGEFEASTKQAFTQAINLNYLATISTKRKFNEMVKIILESKASLIIEHEVISSLLKGTFLSHHIDSDKFLGLLRNILFHKRVTELTSSQSVEKLLLISALVCMPDEMKEGFFQALAVPKKARIDLQIEWDALLRGEEQRAFSPEALWVFGAINES